MAISLLSTKGFAANGVKVLVYGQAGAGKTRLCSTLPTPVILSAESGLLSLTGYDIPYIPISDMQTLQEAYEWVTGAAEAQRFETIVLDSISEIAEVVLTAEKRLAKDPRQAYGEMQSQMAALIRAFRDLPGKNVYFSAKLEKSQNDMGQMLYAPSMPGNKTGQALPYFFDEVFALRIERDAEGNMQRALQCDGDSSWTAKDRSGKLGMWEPPDLGAVIRKITGERTIENDGTDANADADGTEPDAAE